MIGSCGSPPSREGAYSIIFIYAVHMCSTQIDLQTLGDSYSQSARLAEMRIAEPAEEVESDTTADSGDSFIIVKKNAEKTPSPKVAPSEEATIPVSDETAESTPKPTSTPAVAAGPIEKKEPPQKHVESVAPALPVAVANASASTISPAIVEPKPVPIAKNEELDEDWGDDLDEDWGADG